MSARETVRDYYEALRRGEPLYPYFAERDDLVKVAISERLVGYDAVAEALRDQTRTTGDWTVESRDLRVTERGGVAWFDDVVDLSWDLLGRDERVGFETRWSGVLERRTDDGRTVRPGDGEERDGGATGAGEGTDGESDDGEWLFAAMHVSAPREI